MNQWKLLDKFVKISKKHIENLKENGLEYDLLKFQIDEQGPCCSDNQLLEVFAKNIEGEVDESKLYSTIFDICQDYAISLMYGDS